MLSFDEPTHVYRWNGNVVPGVTRALDGLTDYRWVTAEQLELAREEGKAIHYMVELYAKNDLDERELDPWFGPRLVALKKLIADTQMKVIASEEKVYHPGFGYAGCLDLAATLVVPGMDKKPIEARAILDVKRSFAAGAAIGLQLAAYMEAKNAASTEKFDRRYALQLRDDGTYRLREFDDKSDFQTFLACLIRHKWKERHGRQ